MNARCGPFGLCVAAKLTIARRHVDRPVPPPPATASPPHGLLAKHDHHHHHQQTRRDVGENGVGLTGSTDWVDGRSGNQPRHNTIEGNAIYRVGLYTKQSCAIFLAVSCLNTITGNILFHGPRALLNLNDGFGGGTVLDRNLMFDAVLETKDHGQCHASAVDGYRKKDYSVPNCSTLNQLMSPVGRLKRRCTTSTLGTCARQGLSTRGTGCPS